jgi:hypothetical protein
MRERATILLPRKDESMTDEKPNNDNEVTPKGAVEIEESDLDKASGGVSSGGDYNEKASADWQGPVTLDKAAQKVAPADASIGLLRDAEKKLT